MATATRSVNQVLLDRSIRHSIFIERLASGESRAVGATMADVYDDIEDTLSARLDRMNAGENPGAWTTRRYQQMIERIRKTFGEGIATVRAQLVSSLIEIGLAEAAFQARMIADGLGFGFDFVLPSRGTIRDIVTRQPMRGRILREWVQQTERATVQRIQEATRIGIIEGESVPTIARRIRRGRPGGAPGVLDIAKRDLEAVTRTAVNHTSTRTREETYKRNSTLVKAVQWVSTLDSRTTTICQSLDGQTYPVDSGPRPPAHYRCRSTTAPVLKSFDEMGLPGLDIPEGTRASIDGEVPESTTYGQWIKGQPAKVQDEALGRRVATEFRAGRISLDDVYREQRRRLADPLTTREVLALEGIEQ